MGKLNVLPMNAEPRRVVSRRLHQRDRIPRAVPVGVYCPKKGSDDLSGNRKDQAERCDGPRFTFNRYASFVQAHDRAHDGKP